ncbi:MAG TPA: asparagine synthase (glutamine-hydrolyzing) [Pseudonocardiaceae bacterium]|nr:asparagine synthase (glutamine-hydrolyzing) [Pseudonocardiaceae bacterium]
MSGIVALVCPSEVDAESSLPAVAGALRGMRHRGPDDVDTWTGQEAVFGYARLSIIDIEHSRQPLCWGPPESPDRYTIVHDGQVYNYLELRAELMNRHGATFRTNGDAEAVVAAYHYYGPHAVGRLRGMFAFVIWDAERGLAFGARDPFGVKPLYYATGPHGTAFASEKKCLLELSGTLGTNPGLNERAVQQYLTLQYVPEPASMHAGVHRIESGTSFTVASGGDVAAHRYFHPVFRPREVRGDADAQRLYGEITDVLRDSVAKHMRADVTVGAFLSGGVDSTAVAALAKEHSPDLVTFTTGFERQGYSEVDVAAESAATIGVRHVVRTVSAAEMMDTLPLIVWYLDDPVADPALVPLWFIAREARNHVKVVLSGFGADELFGGYHIYREPLDLAPFERVPGALRRAMGRVSTRIPEGVRGKDLLRRGALDLEERYYGNARIFRDDQLRGVLRTFDPGVSHREVTAESYRISAGWDPVARMQHVDLFSFLRGDILVKADKMTAAHSVELRMPFLDTEVFRVASGLPLTEKVTQQATKHALREALRGVVPEPVRTRRTLGLPVPIRHWLRGEMYDWARDVVVRSHTDELINRNAVLRLLEEHRTGTVDHSRRLWALLVFMIWHAVFVERSITPHVSEPRYPVRI